MTDYQPPTHAEFDALAKALAEHTALYEDKIQAIRHNAFAHTGRITQQELHAMFAAVPVSDFERLTVFPLRLHVTLWETYVNGRALALVDTPIAIAELIANPLGRRAVGMEHQHAVREHNRLSAVARVAEAVSGTVHSTEGRFRDSAPVPAPGTGLVSCRPVLEYTCP